MDTLQCGPVLRYSVDLRDTNAYTEPVMLNYAKLATNIRGYTDILYSAAEAGLAWSNARR